ncbi:ribosomal protein L7/L12 [Microbacterium murale]|uniref:Ribosomal protein L7/L12 n=1 Tax=Microbacterium murale TaxID=1081040 RepID=A0ABU0P7N3_9MICO|nr:ribosomal protein L7/L12 [Microbacterium murale]MDQ0642957.1 ribosomal protein L7/L12 [Microbacterium murale]
MEILIVIGFIVVIVVVVLWVRHALRSMRPEAPSIHPAGQGPLQPAAQPTAVTAEAAHEIERLLSQGQKITAIKLMREQTGLGLAEAKNLIDTWPNGVSVAQRRFAPYLASPTAAVPPPAPRGVLPPDIIAQIDHLVAADQKIHAIKLFRAATGVGLKEAKDRIDAWVPRGNAN